MRDQVAQLVALGTLLAESDDSAAGEKLIQKQDVLVRALRELRPATDQEACALTSVFGPDDAFGLAWSVRSFIETAPSWPLHDCIRKMASSFWRRRLQEIAFNASAAAQQGIQADAASPRRLT